jgi:DNA-directed RNA polymerase subunit N (RpoN/RPB10)
MDLSLLENPQVMILPGPCPSCGKRIDKLHYKFVIHLKQGRDPADFFKIKEYDIKRQCCKIALTKPEQVSWNPAIYDLDLIQGKKNYDISSNTSPEPGVMGTILNSTPAMRVYNTSVRSGGMSSVRLSEKTVGYSESVPPPLGGPTYIRRKPLTPGGYSLSTGFASMTLKPTETTPLPLAGMEATNPSLAYEQMQQYASPTVSLTNSPSLSSSTSSLPPLPTPASFTPPPAFNASSTFGLPTPASFTPPPSFGGTPTSTPASFTPPSTPVTPASFNQYRLPPSSSLSTFGPQRISGLPASSRMPSIGTPQLSRTGISKGLIFGNEVIPVRAGTSKQTLTELRNQVESPLNNSLSLLPTLQTRNLGLVLGPSERRETLMVNPETGVTSVSVLGLEKRDYINVTKAIDAMDIEIQPAPAKNARLGQPVQRGYKDVGEGYSVPVLSTYQYAI